MYVYLIPTEPFEPYTVGFYEPSGKWRPESDHKSAESAAERVAFLNGATRSVQCRIEPKGGSER